MMRLSILIYDGLTTLDAIGGYEVFARLPGMETEFVAAHRGIVAADTRCLGLVAFREFSEVTATDILYVPGGPGGFALEKDEIFLDTIRRLDKTSTWTVGICNGVGLLAAAGLLKGLKATTNWFYQDRLRALWDGVCRRALSPRRQVRDRRRRFREHRHRPVSDLADRGRTGREDAATRHRVLSSAAVSRTAAARRGRRNTGSDTSF